MLKSLNAPRGFLLLMLGTLAVIFACHPRLYAQNVPGAKSIEQAYQPKIRPLLKRYCHECHSADRMEAEIDLTAFTTITDVRKRPKVWQKVREILDSGQMPPKDAKQPTDSEQRMLRKWVRDYLTNEARARAGDPGPVILRRLSNAEYTYTIQDLTGVDSLDPTREFPVDGAAGEGFTNAGAAQAMSPSLVTKYLDAAKEVAGHAVLLPHGIRFSKHTTRRDQTNELMARIQAFYRNFTEDGGGTPVNLHGIKFDTNQGGVLPLKKYLEATLAERDALMKGRKTIEKVAHERSLNARYLATLWKTLANESQENPSLLIDALRERWRQAKPEDAPALANEITQARDALWKFNSIGHIGREGGPKSWMESVTPLTTKQELRVKLPDAPSGDDIMVYLSVNDLRDGNDQDFLVLDRPRIEFKAGGPNPPILLRDIRSLAQRIEKTVAAETERTKQYLDAVVALRSSSESIEKLAITKGLNPQLLENWAGLLGLGNRAKRQITGHFTNKLTRGQGYEAINGWGTNQTPNLLTNRSDKPISFLTLTVPARGVTVHPSPTLESVVAWSSPLDGQVRIQGLVADVDDKCGNGAAWRLELLSDSGNAILSSGTIDNGRNQRFQPDTVYNIRKGDVVSLVVNGRDGNHSCDTTHLDLKLSEVDGRKRVWDLASDVVENILKSNPLPDSYGNADIWHFCANGNKPQTESAIPPGSALAHWRAAVVGSKSADEISRLATFVQKIVTATNAESLNDSDKKLRQKLTDWKGPLRWMTSSKDIEVETDSGFGLDPSRFGKHPDGSSLDPANLCLHAPQVLELRLPTKLVAGAEFVTTGTLDPKTGKEGSVQLQVLTTKPGGLSVSAAAPILVNHGSKSQRRVEDAMRDFRNLFPAALCYARIVPVDEVVTLTLYFREDDHLKRLMLDDEQSAELDRLWDELYFVSREPIALTVAFEQISEFATQDRPDLVKSFAPLRKPIQDRAAAFRERLVKTEPAHVEALLKFADRAWRRPLSASEQDGVRGLYHNLRKADLGHEGAIRLTLARVLTSPAFLYKREQPASGKSATPISNEELATRLSYFLWSSTPDDALRRAAQDGKLTETRELVAQTRRMLQAPRARRLAIQFACQWLHIRDFDQNDEKNEKLYPEFVTLRSEMYEETVRFFEDMFRNDGSMLGLLDADHTFLNETLAKHYGIEGVKGSRWQRVDGIRAKGRGGILGMATLLASQSGASRTSPILRGNWVSETLLGERLPRPPANVPLLPETVPSGLTARQLIERHSSMPACAKCHERIDPYGFALEQYDAIGRLRSQVVDTKTTLLGGKKIEGITGLRDYLARDRRDDVIRHFCRKLLGYSLGREVQLSDEVLLTEMQNQLKLNNYRFSVAVEAIVTSRQFREIRGQQMTDD